MLSKKADKQLREKMLISYNNPNARIVEQYRKIMNNIQFLTLDHNNKCILVTSPSEISGNTTTLVNLGLVMAQQDKKVLLIDTNLRKPSLHQIFEIENKLGLTTALLNTSKIEESISTTIQNIDIMPSGPLPPNPSEVLTSQRMQYIVKELHHYYDYLLFDSPPINHFSDTQVLANSCDSSIFFIKSGESKHEESIIATNSLLDSKANLIGAVLSQQK